MIEKLYKYYFFKKNIHFCANNYSILSKFYEIVIYFSNVIDYLCFFFFNLSLILLKLTLFSGFVIKVAELFDKFFVSKIFNCSFISRLLNTLLDRLINNYYLTDVISKNSKVLNIASVNSYLSWYKIV